MDRNFINDYLNGQHSEEEMARAKKPNKSRGNDSKVEEITQTLARLSLQEQKNTRILSESISVTPALVSKDKPKDTKPKAPKPKDTKPKDTKPKRGVTKKKNELIQPPSLPSVPAQAYETTELPLKLI
jgi:hypothetical protein